MTRDLSRLFNPRHVAVIGGGWGVKVVESCLGMGFAGPVWPVHPSRDEICGLPCHRRVADLPEPPDAVFVGVNARLTVDVLAELSAMGAGGAVCFASGFRETAGEIEGGAELEAALVAAAGDMPVLGPNCYGLLNYLDGAALWPDVHGGLRVASGVGIATQSSNLLINLTMQRRGLPVAMCVAAGNQAQTGLPEIAAALVADPRITAVGLHVEGIAEPRAWEALAAAARAAGKPVVILKTGRSEQARAAAVSHTASLAGSDAASRAFFARLGFAAADTVPGFLETLKLAHVHGALPGARLSSMSCSGGEAGLMADAATRHAVEFPAFAAPDRARIKATLSEMVTVANPLDYHTFIWGDAERMCATYRAVIDAGMDLNLLVLDFPRTDRCKGVGWDAALAGIRRAAHESGRPVAVVASLPENMPEEEATALLADGIAPLSGFDEALAAAAAMAGTGRAWAAPLPAPVLAAPPAGTAAILLDEATAKAALAAHGLPVPLNRRAGTPAEAAAAAAALGFPVVLKGLGIAHKTEAGAVRIGLRSAPEVEAAAGAMAAPEGFLVEEMVTGAVAELLVGVTREEPYGFALTLGAGGTLTELLADTETLMIPATAAEIRAALSRLRMAPLLAGHRGRPGADMEALTAAILAVQDYATAAAPRLLELDVNPLMATPSRAVAVDALIRLAGDAAP